MFAQLVQCDGEFLVVAILIEWVHLQLVLLLGSDDTLHESYGRVILAAVFASL